MNKVDLKKMLEEGYSYRKIAENLDCSASKVKYWVNKFNLLLSSSFNKEYQKDVDHDFFKKIDTPEKAYIAGFILGDGYINERFDVHLGVSISDSSILTKISEYLPWEIKISYDNTLDKKTRRFPRARLRLRSRSIGKDLVKHYGDRLASKRHTPRIGRKYEQYLVAGFFDAKGCITFGYRKDRNRLWHKVNFTTSQSILLGIQNILIKNNVSSTIRPKANEDCYILEFANRESIINFYEFLPTDSIRLNRKKEKFNILLNEIHSPLRSESDENGGSPK